MTKLTREYITEMESSVSTHSQSLEAARAAMDAVTKETTRLRQLLDSTQKESMAVSFCGVWNSLVLQKDGDSPSPDSEICGLTISSRLPAPAHFVLFLSVFFFFFKKKHKNKIDDLRRDSQGVDRILSDYKAQLQMIHSETEVLHVDARSLHATVMRLQLDLQAAKERCAKEEAARFALQQSLLNFSGDFDDAAQIHRLKEEKLALELAKQESDSKLEDQETAFNSLTQDITSLNVKIHRVRQSIDEALLKKAERFEFLHSQMNALDAALEVCIYFNSPAKKKGKKKKILISLADFMYVCMCVCVCVCVYVSS